MPRLRRSPPEDDQVRLPDKLTLPADMSAFWQTKVDQYVAQYLTAWRERAKTAFDPSVNARLIGYLVELNEARRKLDIYPVYQHQNGIFADKVGQNSVTSWRVQPDNPRLVYLPDTMTETR